MKKLILILLSLGTLPLCASAQKNIKKMSGVRTQEKTIKMRVDIWSDVMCPFCYIGKRRFEAALAEFPNKENIEVIWHSFQLDPDVKAEPGKDVYSYLAERKGQSLEWSKQAHAQVTEMAAGEGLTYNYDKAVVANSFDAHRIVQLAKKYGKGDAMEEHLFMAYFTDGKDVADHAVLAELATSIGLEANEVKSVLSSNAFTDAVNADINTAAQLRINGVPFFVINNKYGVSGAQAPATFSQALNKAWQEYEQENSNLTIINGDAASCEPGKDCN